MEAPSTTQGGHYPIVTALRDPGVPVDEIIRNVLALSIQYVHKAEQDDRATLGDTPGVESLYWSLWEPLLKLAEEDETIHGRIIALLIGLRSSEVGSNWVLHSQYGGWRDLPCLQTAISDFWNVLELSHVITQEPALSVLEGDLIASMDPVLVDVAKARVQYLNMHRFLSRLWCESGFNLSNYGFSIMQHIVDNSTSDEEHKDEPIMEDDDMEMNSDADRDEEDDGDGEFVPEEDEDDDDDDDFNHPTLNLAVEAASVWISSCAEEMYQVLRRGSDPTRGPPVQWWFWKKAFSGVANTASRFRIASLAKSALEKMESVERYQLDGLYIGPIHASC